MPRKFVTSLLFVSLLLSHWMFFSSPRTAAKDTDILELTAMLPDSDVVATIGKSSLNRLFRLKQNPKVLMNHSNRRSVKKRLTASE